MAEDLASKPDTDPVKEYIEKLDTRELALITHVAEDDVRRVLQTVQDSADQMPIPNQQDDGSLDGNPNRFMQIVKTLDTAAVAADNNIADNIVRRVLKGLLESDRPINHPPKADAYSENNLMMRKMQSRSRIDALLDEIRILAPPLAIGVPAPCLGRMNWPAAPPAHIRLLLRTVNEVLAKSHEYGQSGLVVSKLDMQTLVHGVRRLSAKMCVQTTNLVENLSAEEKRAYVDEEWYLGPGPEEMEGDVLVSPDLVDLQNGGILGQRTPMDSLHVSPDAGEGLKKRQLVRIPGNSPTRKRLRPRSDEMSTELKRKIASLSNAFVAPTTSLVPVLSSGRPRTASLAPDTAWGSIHTTSRHLLVPARLQSQTNTSGFSQQRIAPSIGTYRPLQPPISGGSAIPSSRYIPFRIPAPAPAPPALTQGLGSPVLPQFAPGAVSGPVSGVEDADTRMKKLHQKLDAALKKARKIAGLNDEK